MTLLTSLLERVRAASGPDRELDLDIARALVPDVIVLRWNKETNQNEAFTHWRYTESIDAAVALVERVLPGWTIQLFQLNINKRWIARVLPEDAFNSREDEPLPIAPLAILAALLSAIEQKESTG